MKKIYIDLDTGRKVADSLPELDIMQQRPEHVGAFLVPAWQDFGNIKQYTHAQRVAIW